MNYTFETAMARLEEISAILAENKVTLDQSLELYAEGVKLLDFCNSKLQQAQVKVNEINKNIAEEN